MRSQSKMATSTMASAQLLPRFLLPRLSWQTSTQFGAVRTLSAATTPHRTSSRPSNKQYVTASRCRPTPAARTISILQNNSIKRAFHATQRRARDHHFDTLKFVQRLQEEGFTETQAVAMMKVLSDVIEERFVSHVILFTTLQTILTILQHSKSHTNHGSPRRPSKGNLHAEG